LMFVVRPLNIWVCTWGSEFNWRQKLFISWIGPKGIVSASVASLFAISLTERGIPGGDTIKALVFLTIIVTVVVQGLTAQWVANLLQVNATNAKGAVIVGSNPLARLIARLFQDRNEPVVFIETKAEEVKAAEAENFTVFFKSAMNPDVLEEAGLDSMGTFLAMTKNTEINYVLAQRAVEEFAPPRVLALCSSEIHDPANANPKVQPALTLDLDIKTWNQHIETGDVKLIETEFEPDGFMYQQTYLQALVDAGEVVPLLVKRRGRLQVVRAGEAWEPNDQLFCLLYEPKPRLVLRLSESQQSRAGRLTLEKFPTVKELPIPADRKSDIEAVTQEILTPNGSGDMN
ncbi:MAG: sodium:proton antiporter, partial [Cyanothece sp. SIO2G6]|nr:sodium:proton antiporter [Cyanothece sp. SIO2G6]